MKDEDEVVFDAEAEARRFCEKFANFSWRFCIRAAAQDKVNWMTCISFVLNSPSRSPYLTLFLSYATDPPQISVNRAEQCGCAANEAKQAQRVPGSQ